jgi:hypothetical protein
MKTIFLLLISSIGYAQVDTSQLRSGKLTLKVSDWEYVATFINNESYEGLFDSLKFKVRAMPVYPAPTALITVDSVINSELNYLCFAIKSAYTKANSAASDRIATAIVNLNPWLAHKQGIWDTDSNNIFENKKKNGKKILTKKPN